MRHCRCTLHHSLDETTTTKSKRLVTKESSSTTTKSSCLCGYTSNQLKEFKKKWLLLSVCERSLALRANYLDFLRITHELLPCLACRKNTEIFYQRIQTDIRKLPSCIMNEGIRFVYGNEKETYGYPKEEKENKNGFLLLIPSYWENPEATLCTFLSHQNYGKALIEENMEYSNLSPRFISSYCRNNHHLSSNTPKHLGRCLLHSRGRDPRPTSFLSLWDRLSYECKRRLTCVDSKTFRIDLENYLKRHQFCCGCQGKVIEAYNMLISSIDDNCEKCFEENKEECRLNKREEFNIATNAKELIEFIEEQEETTTIPCYLDHGDLGEEEDDDEDEEDENDEEEEDFFGKLSYCKFTGQIIVPIDDDTILDLMLRVEKEMLGEKNDRHARTIEEAEDEVLTCLGIIIWNKILDLRKTILEEKKTEECFIYCTIAAIERNFNLAVENLHGSEMIEQLLLEEDNERLRLLRKKEKNKQKRKNRKKNKAKKIVEEEEKIIIMKHEEDPISTASSSSRSSSVVDENEKEEEEEDYYNQLLNSMKWKKNEEELISSLHISSDTEETIPDIYIKEYNKKKPDFHYQIKEHRRRTKEKFEHFIEKQKKQFTS